jgi:carboxylate-amine ligase
MKNGTGADRQLKVWNDTNDINAVVDLIIKETTLGLG